VDERQHLLLVLGRAVAPTHAHAAEADLKPLSAPCPRGDHGPSFFAKSALARLTADIAFGHATHIAMYDVPAYVDQAITKLVKFFAIL
jgi:hypothetical protein